MFYRFFFTIVLKYSTVALELDHSLGHLRLARGILRSRTEGSAKVVVVLQVLGGLGTSSVVLATGTSGSKGRGAKGLGNHTTLIGGTNFGHEKLRRTSAINTQTRSWYQLVLTTIKKL